MVKCTIHLTSITNMNLFLSVYTQREWEAYTGISGNFYLNRGSTRREICQPSRLPWIAGE